MDSFLKKDAIKSPASNIILIILLAIGIISFPIKQILLLFIENDSLTLDLLSTFFSRAAFSVLMAVLLVKYGFGNVLSFKIDVKGLFICIPCFLVVINNLPFIALINGDAAVTESGPNIFFFVLYCVSVAAFEEITFRGIIFPIAFIKLKNLKFRLFWSIALSSAVFGLMHLVNLLGGAGIMPVIRQVGYSFLIGSMCAIALCLTKSIVIPIILHSLFNINGLLIETLGSGEIWNVPTIIITAVLGAAVAAYMVFTALKLKNEAAEKLFGTEYEDAGG